MNQTETTYKTAQKEDIANIQKKIIPLPGTPAIFDRQDDETIVEAIARDPWIGYRSFEDAVNDCFYTSQIEAFTRMVHGENIFLSGPAGSGKSTVVEPFIQFIKESEGIVVNEREVVVNIGVTATTGVAASNFNGVTIHSFANLMGQDGSFSFNLKDVDILVIDEISMLPSGLFEKLDKKLRLAKRKPYTPFGGVQLILMGDFQQLPPIPDYDKPREYSRYAIESKIWHEANIKHLYLDKIRRAGSDKVFADLLDRISSGSITDEDIDLLNTRVKNKRELEKILQKRKLIYMYPTNKEIDKVNGKELDSINSKEYKYKANLSIIRNPKSIEATNIVSQYRKKEKDLGTLRLKVGAQVYLTKNHYLSSYSFGDSKEKYLIPSGAIGSVVSLTEKSVFVYFQKEDKKLEVYPVTEDVTCFENHKAQKEVEKINPKTGNTEKVISDVVEKKKVTLGHIEYMPLKLAWATSIHKSQGQTYDGEIVDLRNTFSSGLGYVAVSRVRSLDDLFFSSKVNKGFFDMNKKSFEISRWIKKEALKNRKDFINDSDYYKAVMMPLGINALFNPLDHKVQKGKYSYKDTKKILGIPDNEKPVAF